MLDPSPADGGRAMTARLLPRQGTTLARMRCTTLLEPRRLDALRLVHHEMQDARALDLFRELRTRLLLDAGRDNPVLMVTGARRRCGTTFVARNLAAAIALDPERSALLIDANLRHPSLERDFGLEPGPGLADWLRSPSLPVETLIRQSGVPRLRLITAGRVCPQSGDQLASLRMRALLDELQQRYEDRAVVIDAPVACGSPEARVLGQRAERIVLVAGEAMHRPETLQRAVAGFDAPRFAGVVFNQVP